MSVTLAVSELRSLVTKAARGAGLSWGLAEEAGWAAEWLARQGLPAADWAALWLAARLEGAASPVELGAALADAGMGAEDVTLPDGLPAPGYLLPFLDRLGRTGDLRIVAPLGEVARLTVTGELRFGPCWQAQSAGWRLTRAEAPLAVRPQVAASVLDCLEGLALRTTVPPSESSRRDAGSVGGDND